MYCKNCGQEIDDLAAVCIHCGVAVGNGNKFCQNCGKEVDEKAAFCVHCGVNLNTNSDSGANNSQNQNFQSENQNTNYQQSEKNPNAKSKLAAGLLGIFLGALGIHNFYLGYTSRAVTQLLVSLLTFPLTCGISPAAMQIWGLIEGIFYLIGKNGYTCDANGVPLTD